MKWSLSFLFGTKANKARCTFAELPSLTDGRTAKRYLEIMVQSGLSEALLNTKQPVDLSLAKVLKTYLDRDVDDDATIMRLIETDLENLLKTITPKPRSEHINDPEYLNNNEITKTILEDLDVDELDDDDSYIRHHDCGGPGCLD